ncbi:bactofilin [Rossellomorea vietnamensis]|uniref:Bactofilin n=2 Tax=Rossellomorea TaxID=2837508 RepID=A0A5D4KAG4_9BACI|nr:MULTISPECIES: bactofilin [Rossellomorea]TYR74347.1 bactofilin [Rossellomorea vietnamensis]TYS77060.1 bactofilin [Rossellomorea aquimaris]
MSGERTKRLKVIGEGTYPGGDYEKVNVTGQGKVSGNLRAVETKVTGEGHVKGKAAINQLKVTGKLTIDEELSSNELNIIGELNVGSSLKANSGTVRGFLNSSGNAELEKLEVKGGVNINGLLNVGELIINLQGAPSKATEIGGETIKVKGRSFFSRPQTLQAEVIEGDSIYLENTTAKMVRGSNVEIGSGCHIEKVEYRSTFINKDKTILEAKKI